MAKWKFRRLTPQEIRKNWKTNLLYASAIGLAIGFITGLLEYAYDTASFDWQAIIIQVILSGAFTGYLLPYLQERWDR